MQEYSYEESLNKLNDNQWNNLSVAEKVGVLQSVENEMAKRYHRLPCKVSAEPMVCKYGGIQLGGYGAFDKEITLNSLQLESNSEFGKDYKNALNTILHEGRHAYQDQAVLGYVNHRDISEMQTWRNNMMPGGYISFNQNPQRYYRQPVEQDAREFAENMVMQIESEKGLLSKQIQGINQEDRNDTVYNGQKQRKSGAEILKNQYKGMASKEENHSYNKATILKEQYQNSKLEDFSYKSKGQNEKYHARRQMENEPREQNEKYRAQRR